MAKKLSASFVDRPIAKRARSAGSLRWLRIAGVLAFAFFLLKGLVWLGVGAALVLVWLF